MLARLRGAIEAMRAKAALKRRFDARAYLALYPDVARSGADPFAHYCAFGAAEGRQFPLRRHRIPRWRRAAAIRASGLFDEAFYGATCSPAERGGLSPVRHYLERGFLQGLDPGPNFCTHWYQAQNPDVGADNPLLHYLEIGQFEHRPTRPPDGVIAAAEKLFADVAPLDPVLASSVRHAAVLALPILDGRRAPPRVKRVVAQTLGELGRAPTHLIVLPWMTFGGADLFAAHVARAALETVAPQDLAVLVLDHDRLDAQAWLPEGIRLVNLAPRLAPLDAAGRLDAVQALLQVLQPKALLNINSALMWQAIAERGAVLRHYTRLYACLFCRDFAADGRPAGYADTHFRAAFPALAGVYTDNQRFIAEQAERFGLTGVDRSQFVALQAPPRIAVARRAAARGRQPGEALRLLWAGRFCAQKNMPLLAEFMRALPPGWHLDLWGAGEPGDRAPLEAAIAAGAPATLRGGFSSFEALPLADYDACLYTSLWDGLPNVVLEAAASGLPLVASDTGGIGELVTSDTGWLVPAQSGAPAYLAALADIAARPDEAERRALALMARVEQRHRPDLFAQALGAPGHFLEPAA